MPFKPTHTIGGVPVERIQVAGLGDRWMDASGDVCRPTGGKPLVEIVAPSGEAADREMLNQDLMDLQRAEARAATLRARVSKRIGDVLLTRAELAVCYQAYNTNNYSESETGGICANISGRGGVVTFYRSEQGVSKRYRILLPDNVQCDIVAEDAT